MSANINWHGVILGPSAALTGSGGGDDAVELQQKIGAVFGSVAPKPTNNESVIEHVLLNVSEVKATSPTVHTGVYRNWFQEAHDLIAGSFGPVPRSMERNERVALVFRRNCTALVERYAAKVVGRYC